MKFTITRINRQNKLMVSTKTVDSFLERIAKDDAKQSVARFRMSVPLMEGDYQYYKGIREWQHVYPAAEFSKDESGNLVFQKSNGLVILHFTNLMTNQEKDAAKTAASLLPMTFAAIEGADGRSLIVLVNISNEEGKIPTKEEEADLLYQSAYEQVKTLYQAQVHATIKPEKPSLESNFMLTMDASPYYNNKAVAMRIASNQFAVATAPKSIDDLKAYEDYEFLYRKPTEETMPEMKKANISWNNDNDRFLASLSAIASKLCVMGLNEEETFVHIRRNNWSKVAEEQLRQIVGTAYDSHSKDKRVEKSASARKGRADILQMINYLESRYQFRYNTVMKYTEYRPNNSWIGDFKPVDARVQKSMTLAVQIADIHVSIKDVRNFLESDRIRNYSPIESYLYDCLGKWDGKDRIRALARTVPTNNPHWEDWFYTWFLGMVDQWRGL
ncbi:MAG: BT4734/BF3469 family protein [Segatella copri]